MGNRDRGAGRHRWRLVDGSHGRPKGARHLRRFLAFLSLVVVVPLVEVASSVPAFASTYAYGSTDGSGHTIACSITYTSVDTIGGSATYTTADGNANSYGFGAQDYWTGSSNKYFFGFKAKCNTNTNGSGTQLNFYVETHTVDFQTDVDCLVGNSPVCGSHMTGTDSAAGNGSYTISEPITDGELGCVDPANIDTTSRGYSSDYSNGSALCYGGAPAIRCSDNSTTSGNTPDNSCLVTTETVGTGTPPAPTVGWGTESVGSPPLPAPGNPTVSCTVTTNPNTGYMEYSIVATEASGDVGDVLTQDVDFGDGSTHATTATGRHTYSLSGQPAGGWTVNIVVTATGDGIHATGTTTSSCDKVVDGTSNNLGPANTNTPGAPTSCGWTDFLCDIKAAFAWLFVPDAAFFTSWNSFTGAITTKAPFAYIAGISTWTYDFIGLASTDVTSSPSSGMVVNYGSGVTYTVPTSGSGSVLGTYWPPIISDLILAVTAAGLGLTVVAEARRIVRSH